MGTADHGKASACTRATWIAALVLSAGSSAPAGGRQTGRQAARGLAAISGAFPSRSRFTCPSGCIVLVPVLEIAGAFRPALREAAGFVLGLAFAACLGTLALGYLLAYGSGDTGTTVTRHMWGGIALAIGVDDLPADSSGVVLGSRAACLSGAAWVRAAGAGVDRAPGRLVDSRFRLSHRGTCPRP